MTQNTEPTAGEWVVIDEPEIFGDDGRLSIKYGYYYLASILTSDAVNLKEAKANAHCMAASRDMQKALAPFAEFERVRSAAGGNTPKSGLLWAVNTKAGEAEITVEMMQAVIAALEKSKVKP